MKKQSFTSKILVAVFLFLAVFSFTAFDYTSARSSINVENVQAETAQTYVLYEENFDDAITRLDFSSGINFPKTLPTVGFIPKAQEVQVVLISKTDDFTFLEISTT